MAAFLVNHGCSGRLFWSNARIISRKSGLKNWKSRKRRKLKKNGKAAGKKKVQRARKLFGKKSCLNNYLLSPFATFLGVSPVTHRAQVAAPSLPLFSISPQHPIFLYPSRQPHRVQLRGFWDDAARFGSVIINLSSNEQMRLRHGGCLGCGSKPGFKL